MKDFEKLLLSVVNDYEEEYGAEGLLEELFPGTTLGEIVVEMYLAGMIPEDVIERFINE
jgi:hypothetical protein